MLREETLDVRDVSLTDLRYFKFDGYFNISPLFPAVKNFYLRNYLSYEIAFDNLVKRVRDTSVKPVQLGWDIEAFMLSYLKEFKWNVAFTNGDGVTEQIPLKVQTEFTLLKATSISQPNNHEIFVYIPPTSLFPAIDCAIAHGETKSLYLFQIKKERCRSHQMDE